MATSAEKTTVSGIFANFGNASQAVRDLEAAGVPASQISFVAHDAAHDYEGNKASEPSTATETGAGIGAVGGGAIGLLTGLGMMAIPGVGPVVAAGWLAATAAGAVAGGIVGAAAGGIVASFTGAGVSSEDAHLYAEHIRRGGSVVVVRTDTFHEDDVRAILTRNQQLDAAQQRHSYEAEGWSGSDPGHGTLVADHSVDRPGEFGDSI
jgi:hypothetical protein